MEGNESGLSPYYHQHPHHHPTTGTTTTTTITSTTNGLFSNPHHHHQQQQQNQLHHHQQHNPSSTHYSSSSEPTTHLFSPHSVTGRSPLASSPPPPPPPETVRRKRGRPRKYGTPETTTSTPTPPQPLSNKKSPSSTSLPLPSSPTKKETSSVSSPSSKKSQLLGLGNAGQGFTPHVISVAAGEDVAQKIMTFMQQRKRAVCILSASGSLSNASLLQPATLGGNVTYEGRFEILSLSGSYLHTETGGASSRTGGLSVCLSGTDGSIIGGGVGGPLKAAGPVQVIVASFIFDPKKEANVDLKVDTSTSNLPPAVVGATISSVGFRSPHDSSGRTSMRANDDHHQHFGGSSFMLQSRGIGMPSRLTDWRSDLTGNADLGGCQSPEDGDDEHLHD